MKLSDRELKKLYEDLVDWIRSQMKAIGAKNIVLGISGGKDSTVAAGLCKEALGSERVYGLLMPKGEDKNLEDGIKICDQLGINYHILDISKADGAILSLVEDTGLSPSSQAKINLPPRLRTVLMYAFAQSLGDALVLNTSNLSEDYIGYVTIYGDTAGAFAPLGGLTSDEVVQLGLFMGLDEALVKKRPEDGLTGKIDEEIFGFSYDVLNNYIRFGEIGDRAIKEKIDAMHRSSRFKFEALPKYIPDFPKKN